MASRKFWSEVKGYWLNGSGQKSILVQCPKPWNI